MLKKLLSIVLAVLVAVPSAGIGAGAAFAKKESDCRLISKEAVRSENGYISFKYVDENGREISPVASKNARSTNKAYNLPKKYDARKDGYVTSVKDQDPFGTCWAFAYCSAAETSLIRQGYAANGNINISEAHLAWFSATSYDADSSNPADGDGMCLDTYSAFDFGGSDCFSNAAAAKWAGLAKDKNYRYSDDAEKMAFDKSEKYVSDYQLVSAKKSLYNYESVNDMKSAILRSGSVTLIFSLIDEYLTDSRHGYNYYCPEMLGGDHEVVVVGWDDNYSADNFYCQPEGDGAWLVKNSWGKSWGDGGYFWLSYHDMSITEYGELCVVPSGNFLHNYQYDGFAPMGLLEIKGSKGYIANIFTADGNEKVTSAAFTNDLGNGYVAKVSLYRNLKNSDDPTSGTYCETKTVTCAQYGYYTVDFSSEYSLEENEKFSVVVEMYSNADYTYCCVEGKSNDGEKDDIHEEDDKVFEDESYIYNFSSEPGQSFMSSDGHSWKDTNKLGYNNVPIKAFTIPEKPINSVKLKTSPRKTEYYEGNLFETEGMSLTVKYVDGTSKTIRSGFGVNKSELNKVGENNITVSYGGKSVNIKVNVLPRPDDAVTGIEMDDIRVRPNKWTAAEPVVHGGCGDNYTLRYSCSDPYRLYIDAYGNICGVYKGTYTVYCVVTDQYGYSYQDSCTVTVKNTFSDWLIIIFLFGWIWY